MNNNIVFIKYTTKIPEGYALVPIDPTEKMTVAYYKLLIAIMQRKYSMLW